MKVSITRPKDKTPLYNVCRDCGKTYPNLLMIRHELWKEISGGKEVLCLACMEKRLGRLITFEDLQPCGITNSVMLGVFLYLRDKPDIEFSPTFAEDY